MEITEAPPRKLGSARQFERTAHDQDEGNFLAGPQRRCSAEGRIFQAWGNFPG